MMKQFMHVGVPTDKIMEDAVYAEAIKTYIVCLLYTSPSPRDCS